jgi:hypothetical protein
MEFHFMILNFVYVLFIVTFKALMLVYLSNAFELIKYFLPALCYLVFFFVYNYSFIHFCLQAYRTYHLFSKLLIMYHLAPIEF